MNPTEYAKSLNLIRRHTSIIWRAACAMRHEASTRRRVLKFIGRDLELIESSSESLLDYLSELQGIMEEHNNE